jgi:hypothetical protein
VLFLDQQECFLVYNSWMLQTLNVHYAYFSCKMWELRPLSP